MRTLAERFWAKVDKSGDCWVWTSCVDANGYGKFSVKNRSAYAHIVAVDLTRGGTPDGLELDHLCRNPACVNPDHLEAVTHVENVRRGVSGARAAERGRAVTHCRKGHAFDDVNTMVNATGPRAGRRHCRTCLREANRRYYREKVALASLA